MQKSKLRYPPPAVAKAMADKMADGCLVEKIHKKTKSRWIVVQNRPRCQDLQQRPVKFAG